MSHAGCVILCQCGQLSKEHDWMKSELKYFKEILYNQNRKNLCQVRICVIGILNALDLTMRDIVVNLRLGSE